jgi:hypothetical protein
MLKAKVSEIIDRKQQQIGITEGVPYVSSSLKDVMEKRVQQNEKAHNIAKSVAMREHKTLPQDKSETIGEEKIEFNKFHVEEEAPNTHAFGYKEPAPPKTV